MASGVAGWKNGEKVWSVEHNGEEGVFHLDTQGSPPDSLEEIVSSHRSQQEAEGGESAGVDLIFEIPVVLAEKLTGFHHEGDYDYGDCDPWHVCEIPSLAVTGRPGKTGCLPIVLLAGAGLASLVTNKIG